MYPGVRLLYTLFVSEILGSIVIFSIAIGPGELNCDVYYEKKKAGKIAQKMREPGVFETNIFL